MKEELKEKIKKLPKSPGVYLFRSSKKRIIYVGKAINLKNRVGTYFSAMPKDPKTQELISNISSIDWIKVGSEFEALILEADLIKRYKPKYNIRLKDDKNYVYLKITKEDYPRLSVVHQITDSEAEYIGPFVDANAIRQILKIARKIFPYCSCEKRTGEVCLYYHIGLCLGHDKNHIPKNVYKKNLAGIKKLFQGKVEDLVKDFQQKMELAAQKMNFEEAAKYRDKIKYLDRIKKSHFISERDLASDAALLELTKKLGLSKIPERIECFDISNIMGTEKTASMVVFIKGIASPKNYRRFQVKTVKGANDFASMAEILKRRFSLSGKNKKDESFSVLPDLVILDGGKGQLSAVLKNTKIPQNISVIAIAKKKEQIFSLKNNVFIETNLKENSEALFLLQRIRDEAHRFAVTYHRKLKSKEMLKSSLDTIVGIGPKTKKKLFKEFGSLKKIKDASPEELVLIVGNKLAKKIKEEL